MSTKGYEAAIVDESDDVQQRTIRHMNPNLIRGISLVIVLSIWQIYGMNVNPLFFAPPTAIIGAFFRVVQSGELLQAFYVSAQALFLGFIVATIFGIIVGILMGRYRILEYALDPYVNALYATPLVALIPLIILWFGLGFNAKVVVVFLLTLFPVLINSYTGVRNVSQSLVDVGRAFVANERQIFTKIMLPASVPYIMAGVRLGIGRAIIGMVVAEFFTALTGLGAMIVKYANSFKTDVMFVPIVVLMLLGVGLTELVKLAEVRAAPWKETERAQG